VSVHPSKRVPRALQGQYQSHRLGVLPTSRLQVSFLRTPANHEEDVAVITSHWTSAASTLLDGTQMQAVEAAFGSFWAVASTYVAPYCVPDQFRWYDQQVWPTKSPLLRVQPAALTPGTTGTAVLPPQCAASITLETDARTRWGRFYLPALATIALDTATGRMLPGAVDALAQAGATWLLNAKTAGAIPVIWSPKGGKGPPAFAAGSVVPVQDVRCDDIVDIIRSRRWQDSPYRHVVPV